MSSQSIHGSPSLATRRVPVGFHLLRIWRIVSELTMILILVKAIAILRTKKRSKNMLREKKG